MASSFEKTTMRSQLARQLAGRISMLGLKPGDVLGTEQDLANEFGVSVRTIREAAGQLRAIGILTSRRRVGLIVTEPDPSDLLTSVLPVYGQFAENVEELRKLRYVIEMGAVELAVENVTEEQLARMEELAEEYSKLAKQVRHRQTDKYDIEFHELLLDATGSELVGSFHSVIVRYFAKSAEHPEISEEISMDRAVDHHTICTALRGRGVEEVRKVLAAHLRWPWERT